MRAAPELRSRNSKQLCRHTVRLLLCFFYFLVSLLHLQAPTAEGKFHVVKDWLDFLFLHHGAEQSGGILRVAQQRDSAVSGYNP